jgi:hypothetical protein
MDNNGHQINFENGPLSLFLYALKSPESKRQYPARLKKFFDFIPIETTNEIENKEDIKNALNEQSIIFLNNAKNNQDWCLTSILSFIWYLKNKQQKGQILEKSKVKLLQKWDGNRPSTLNLIGSFYAYLVSKKMEEQKKISDRQLSLFS